MYCITQRSNMASIAVTVISVLLALLFIVSGSMKLTPVINEDIHQHMKNEFKIYTEVFPFQSLTGWQPEANFYRIAIGVIELVCGLLIVFTSGSINLVGNVTLAVIMVGAMYTLWMLGRDCGEMVPAIVSFILLEYLMCTIHMGPDRTSGEEKKTK